LAVDLTGVCDGLVEVETVRYAISEMDFITVPANIHHTFATPTLLASDGPVPGLRLFKPAPGALDLRPLLKIS